MTERSDVTAAQGLGKQTGCSGRGAAVGGPAGAGSAVNRPPVQRGDQGRITLTDVMGEAHLARIGRPPAPGLQIGAQRAGAAGLAGVEFGDGGGAGHTIGGEAAPGLKSDQRGRDRPAAGIKIAPPAGRRGETDLARGKRGVETVLPVYSAAPAAPWAATASI